MKRLILFILLLLFITSTAYADHGNLRYSIMVSKFENRSNWSGQFAVGDTFGAILTDSLQQTGKFIVLGEKDMRGEAMAEQDFAASGRTASGNKAPVKGQMTPAQLLVKGEITHFQTTEGGGGGLSIRGFRIGGGASKAEINVIIYVVDSTTGQVVASQKVVGEAQSSSLSVGFTDRDWGADIGGFKKTNVGKAVEQAIDQAVAFISAQIGHIPWQGSVIMVKDGKVYINRGSREGVEPGQSFKVGRSEQLRDPDTGEVLDSSMESSGAVVVDSVKEKISICRVIEGQGRIEKGMTVMPYGGGIDVTHDPAKSEPAGADRGAISEKSSSAENDTTPLSETSEQKMPSGQYRAYNNYDFRAGEKIIFEDDFRSDEDGEFPAHWELISGQAVVNKVLGLPGLLITDGNYGKVFPRLKTKQYLNDEFTIEFDHTMQSVNRPADLILFLVDAEGKEATVAFGESEVHFSGGKNFGANLPDDVRNKNYEDKWNHIAIACRNHQMKVYVNQYRVLVIPNMDFTPVSVRFGGIGDQKSPLVFTNLKIAEGGRMNMLQKLTTEGRLVVHGIKFDYNKAIIKPESMGVINDIAKLMKENASINFEIQGHTDGDGDAAYNMKLSQARADAVKALLIEAGIGASRLTSKGYGKSRPIADNNTPEGKASNRRVEFVKM